jgi:hypothetical protein
MKHLCTLLFLSLVLHAASQPIFTASGLAIRGYDPVAYFSENKPVEGLKEFSFTWQEVEWRFKNKANMELFKSSPEKYAPQFGGFCAYGVSDNHKSPTDPSAFTVVNDKLYLNYSPKVKELWSKDRDGHIKRAETNWVKLENSKE